MAVRIVDLQLIYGVSGAREQFESLVTQLVKGESPDADGVRTKGGDAGLDIRVGRLDDPDGIDVYQCKFFPQGIGPVQQDQIRRSYQRCRDSGEYKAKTWTLCLPVDLSVEEAKWFDDWRQKQAGDGIDITDPWGATRLESLLHLPKNRELRESYFKQEHLAQLREVHSLLVQLVPDLAARLKADDADREAAREAAEQGRTAGYVERFVRDLRTHYAALAAPPRASLGAIQSAKRAGDQMRARELAEAGRGPGGWEVLIHPDRVGERTRFDTLTECWQAAEQSCLVFSGGLSFPSVRHGQRTAGADWIEFTYKDGRDIETWRLSQSAAFAWMSPVRDDFDPPAGWVQVGTRYYPARTLGVDELVRNVTLAFRFAARLAARSGLPAGDGIVVSIRLTRTAYRALRPAGGLWLRGEHRATAPELQNSWTYTRSTLEADADGAAARACNWFFERFNWLHVTAEEVERLQADVFSR